MNILEIMFTLEVEAYDDNGNVSIDNPIIVDNTTTTTLPPTELITNGSFENYE